MLYVADSAAMEALGASFAASGVTQATIYLVGELGAGKTTLVRGFIHRLGHQGAVRSPTFTLMEPYLVGTVRIYHFDLYRLADPEELEYIGARDYFGERALCFIEWPERGVGALPPADLTVRIQTRADGREVELDYATETGALLAGLIQSPGRG